ncbi:MAG: hypothetical protein BWX62_01227 [Bacteroidetes bacterium ADurb.Bin037]|nr:MAG: hypothetical protein BWX62_01227 [Bacteroidetes bacterium ADurb.Bin037]
MCLGFSFIGLTTLNAQPIDVIADIDPDGYGGGIGLVGDVNSGYYITYEDLLMIRADYEKQPNGYYDVSISIIPYGPFSYTINVTDVISYYNTLPGGNGFWFSVSGYWNDGTYYYPFYVYREIEF